MVTNMHDPVFDKINTTDSGCWEYQGAKLQSGYGKLGRRINGKPITYVAHRYVYELMVGKIPDGMFLCHHCDNKICCNPEHMFVGTQKDNMHDAYKKGRMPKNPHQHKNWRYGDHNNKGENNGNSKLSKDDVKYIKHLYFAERRNQSELARYFNVGRTQIARVVNNLAWV